MKLVTFLLVGKRKDREKKNAIWNREFLRKWAEGQNARNETDWISVF